MSATVRSSTSVARFLINQSKTWPRRWIETSTNCSKLTLSSTTFRAIVKGSEGLSKWTLRSPTTKSLSQATYDSSKSVNCSKNIAFVSFFFRLGEGRWGGWWGRGGGVMVNAREHNSVAVKGNTNFTDFKSSENKISGGNCNFLCQTVTIQYSKTTARTRHSRRGPQTKPWRGQSYTVTLVTFREEYGQVCYNYEDGQSC